MEINDTQILDGLYKKHRDLHVETKKVEAGIVAYGGSIPQYTGEAVKSTPVATATAITVYPTHGTWKDKILFALSIKSPALISDIVDYLAKHEKHVEKPSILSTVSQYCPVMFKDGLLNRVPGFGKAFLYSLK